MRTWKCIGTITLMILFFAPMAFANMPIETAISQQSLNMADEKDQVEDVIKKSDVKQFLVEYKKELNRKSLSDIESPTELEYDTPYKVVIPDNDTMQDLLNGTNLAKSLKTCPYRWIVPVLAEKGSHMVPVASFSIAHRESKWQVVEIGGYLSPEQIMFISDSEKLAAFFKNNSLKNTDSFVRLQLLGLHMDLLYLDAKDQEYFVPLIHARDELYGLRNKTLYTRAEVVAAIGPVLKEGSGPNPLILGQPTVTPVAAINNESSQQSFIPMVPMIFLGLLLAIGAVYGYRKLILKA